MTAEISESKILKCCFTGYRPDKLPFNIYVKDKAYLDFENLLIDGIVKLINEDYLVFYTGMAMGFDMLCAEAVLFLKSQYNKNLRLICAIPFKTQGDTFSDFWKERYYNILNRCDESVILSDTYHKGCYHKRNKFMVDNSDCVLTWFDGKSGGTKNTVEYAMKNNRFILNLNKNCCEDFYPQSQIDIF